MPPRWITASARPVSAVIFEDRNQVWQEPVDRNVFGLLEQFGDAEVAAMVAPRSLVIEAARGPELTLVTKNGAPGTLVTPRLEDVRMEFARARALVAGLDPKPQLELVVSGEGSGPFGSEAALDSFLNGLGDRLHLAPQGAAPDPSQSSC